MKLFWTFKLRSDSMDIGVKIADVLLPIFIPHHCYLYFPMKCVIVFCPKIFVLKVMAGVKGFVKSK
jgi:hypothetical protein